MNGTAPGLPEFTGLRAVHEDYISQKADPKVVNS